MPNPLPAIKWLTSWIIPGGRRKNFGTVYLSKEIFLEGRLLRLLEGVNRRTTLLPKFAGIINGRSNFEVWAWDEETHHKNTKCLWEPRESGPEALEYGWEHYDSWSHEHKGTDEKKSAYSLSCEWLNHIS